MAVTIKDVAKAAGFSTATVSRVVNGSSLIPLDTSEKVRKVMLNLEYFPNSIARSFAHQSTYTVALIVDIDNMDAFNNPFFYQIQYGIEKVLSSRSYYLMIANEKTMISHETALNKLIFEKRVDGIILPASLLKKNLVKRMEKEKFPFVVIGEPQESFTINWVDINNKMAGEIAAKHLIKNGFKKIAFISGNLKDIFNKNRLNGYLDVLGKNNIHISQDLLKEGGFTKEDGYRIMKLLLESKHRPDSVIVTNNIAAFGALMAIKEKGYSVPEEIGLISFDSYPVAEFSEPNMTTVDIDVFDLGIQAATMLLKEIEIPSASMQHSLLSVNLISRGTGERPENRR